MSVFLQGLLMGFAYVAPIGLQNLFVINTALSQNRVRAYSVASIVIFFDITLALACFYGIGFLMEKFDWLQMSILLVGSLLVIYIGIQLLRSKAEESTVDVNIPLIRAIAMACAVTWFNPQALIDGTMMLGAFRASLAPEEGYAFIAGVLAASAIWFYGITTIISFFSAQITPKVLQWINWICGAVIILYGLKLFWHFIELII